MSVRSFAGGAVVAGAPGAGTREWVATYRLAEHHGTPLRCGCSATRSSRRSGPRSASA